MTPVKDNTSYITNATGSIDYTYYDKRARMARSLAFYDLLNALKGIFRMPRISLSMPAATRGCCSTCAWPP